MSWWISLESEVCPTCQKSDSIEVRNLTYNNSKILSRLNLHPDFLQGKIAFELIPLLQKAEETSYDIEAELLTLAPSNNWGGVQDCRDFIKLLLHKCRKNCFARVRIN